MSVPGDFCAILFHVPAHAHAHDDNASCNVCWLLSVAVFRVFPRRRFPRVGCCPSRIIRACRARDQSIRETRDEQVPTIFVHDTPHVGAVSLVYVSALTGAVVQLF